MKKKFPLLWKLLFLSILLHLLLVVLFGFWIIRSSLKDIKPPPVWVNLTQPPRQLADIAKPAKEEKPDKAAAEGLYNQKAKEETVAPSTKKSASRPSSPSRPESPPRPKETPKKSPAPAPEPKPQPVPEPPPAQHIPGMPGQMAAPSQDFLTGYKVGNRTYINVNANPGIGYFVELKRKFRLTWSPQSILRMYADQARGRKQVSVVLGVSVNAGGGLNNVFVIKSSGLPGFDGEGIRTIKASAPFSPPPADKLSPDKLLDMAWTFTVSFY